MKEFFKGAAVVFKILWHMLSLGIGVFSIACVCKKLFDGDL